MLASAFLLLSWLVVLPSEPATIRLQRAIDESMAHRRGAAVALDVETGQVLGGFHMDVAARRLAAPGSTMKPFTMMALVEAGLLTEDTGLMCPTKVRIGAHVLDCSHPAIPGPMDVVLALAYSCNYFFTTLAGHLPLDALPREFSRVGLASVTGKWPTEIPGVVIPPKSISQMQLMAVGEEGVRVTPLALAEAYRGLIRPLRDPQSVTPGLQLAVKGMEAAVTKGTAQSAASGTAQVAGKTGSLAGHGWFVGFAPAERPQIVIVIFVEQGTGGKDAAPIAGRVFESYFAKSKAAR